MREFDNALCRQVRSLPELLRQQYADLEPKTRSALTDAGDFLHSTNCFDRLR